MKIGDIVYCNGEGDSIYRLHQKSDNGHYFLQGVTGGAAGWKEEQQIRVVPNDHLKSIIWKYSKIINDLIYKIKP